MEYTPTPAVNGPSQRLASQEEQAAQIHSGHFRAHESQFSPDIPSISSQEQTVPSNSPHGTANPHFPPSDIKIPIAPSTKSNTLHGEKRTVFEHAQIWSGITDGLLIPSQSLLKTIYFWKAIG